MSSKEVKRQPKASPGAVTEHKEAELQVEELEGRIAPRLAANHNEVFLIGC